MAETSDTRTKSGKHGAQIEASPIIEKCPYGEQRCADRQFRLDVLETHMRMIHRPNYMHTIKPCKYNTAHVYPELELSLHERNCADRMTFAQIEAYIDDDQAHNATTWQPLDTLHKRVNDTFNQDYNRRVVPRRDYQA